ncbi:MAG: ribonuclease R [Bacilli bacterium]|nr:ribonuclease R [Bacilli bacterium]
MDYKQLILDVMSSSKYKGNDVEGWKQYFAVKNNNDFTSLVKSLNVLEEEYLIMRDEKDCYFTLEQLGCLTGILKINPKGFGFVENDEVSVYANRCEIKKALDGDEVLIKLIHNQDDSHECEILKVIKHSKKTVIGVIKKRDKRTWFLPDTDMHDRRFKITNLKDFKLVNDTKVQLYIDKYGSTLECSILQILGYKYDPGIDILSILLEHDIEPTFPKGVMQEVNRIEESVSAEEKKGRLDLTNEIIITIDGDDSKDLDDAIHVKKIAKGYQLGVHIADVSHYVKAGSTIDKEAYHRSTSVYVVDRVVPMLPHALSNGICSLNPKVERLTLSCIMDIDEQGKVFNYQIVPSFIKTTERMTYKHVNKMLAHDDKMCRRYNHILGMVELMEELSQIIRKKRHDNGNIDFDTKESKIIVDAKGKVKDIVLRERGESEQIIEDFMISANECVAAHVKFMDLPSIYRVHEVPEAKKMREFANVAASLGFKYKGDVNKVYPKQLQQMLENASTHPSYSVLSTYMLRSMRKARYDVNCLGHFGLALNEYTHFTSPIRRYPDLIVHRMLRKYFFHGVNDVNEIDKDITWIEEAAIHTSKQERNAIEAERDVDDMKKCEYMEKYIGAKYNGIISSVTKFGMFVELANTVEGLVHITNMKDDYYHYDDNSKSLIGETNKKRYHMGQEVRVKVIDASKFKKQIDFEIVKG